MPTINLSTYSKGFTLSELIIALAILGFIATFAIPKLLTLQRNQMYNANAKEVIATISGAFQAYQSKKRVTADTADTDLTPYFNHLYLDTTRTIDNKYGSVTLPCSIGGGGCLVLHNGGVLRYNGSSFGGSDTTNALEFIYDPDGILTDSTTDGPGKALDLFLYQSGRLTTRGGILPNTVAGGMTYVAPAPSADPPWFSW